MVLVLRLLALAASIAAIAHAAEGSLFSKSTSNNDELNSKVSQWIV